MYIRGLLQEIEGIDGKYEFLRDGLEETPKRVAEAYKTWFSGYSKDPSEILKVFEDGAENYDQMVVRKGIPVYSHCEHHMAPIFGEATVAYIPNGRIVGLSKLDRLVDMYARRLQVQERMTQQIAEALWAHLHPLGCGVFIKARHMCIESRGVSNLNSETVTQSLKGVFVTEPETRNEFLSLARN
jgi:GTP cyclohydrolase I